jgi:hypothetical protein
VTSVRPILNVFDTSLVRPLVLILGRLCLQIPRRSISPCFDCNSLSDLDREPQIETSKLFHPQIGCVLTRPLVSALNVTGARSVGQIPACFYQRRCNSLSRISRLYASNTTACPWNKSVKFFRCVLTLPYFCFPLSTHDSSVSSSA